MGSTETERRSPSDAIAPTRVAFRLPDLARHLALAGKFAAIATTLEALHLTGAARLAPARLRGRGAILTLHHVRPFEAGRFHASAHLEITPDFLDALIARLKHRGYEVIPLADVPARLAAPEGGPRFVALTLDDGYRDNLVHALPVFERHGVPFTVFATSGFVGRDRTVWWLTLERLVAARDEIAWDTGDSHLRFACSSHRAKAMTFRRIVDWMNGVDEDWAVATLDRVAGQHGLSATDITAEAVMDAEELRRLARSPLATIGAHTWSHVNLRRVSRDRLVDEIERGTEEVGALLGTRPTLFAYPYGSRDSAGAREFTAAGGFDLAVTTRPGTLKPRDLGRRAALPRISVNGLFQHPAWVEVLLSGLAFELLPRRDDLD